MGRHIVFVCSTWLSIHMTYWQGLHLCCVHGEWPTLYLLMVWRKTAFDQQQIQHGICTLYPGIYHVHWVWSMLPLAGYAGYDQSYACWWPDAKLHGTFVLVHWALLSTCIIWGFIYAAFRGMINAVFADGLLQNCIQPSASIAKKLYF